MASTHIVQSTPETVRSGYLDPAAEPVAVIQPGDTVRYPSIWTHWGNEAKFGMSFADREPLRHRYPHGPYSMLGPVEVSGAGPGDVVEVSITALRTIGWGRSCCCERVPATRSHPTAGLLTVRAIWHPGTLSTSRTCRPQEGRCRST